MIRAAPQSSSRSARPPPAPTRSPQPDARRTTPSPLHLSSNPRIPLVISIILPIATFAAVDPGEVFDRLDALDELGIFVPELALDAEPERGSVGHWKQVAVHSPGEDGLRVESVHQVDAL